MSTSNGLKRSISQTADHDDVENIGMGQTVSRLRDELVNDTKKTDDPKASNVQVAGEQSRGKAGDDWEKVERATKRRKKTDGNYPAIAHAPNARLQTFTKISDLQNLVLYLLADGTSPQWVAVRHHKNFQKVVVLMVPGLEADMFTGKLPLEQLPSTTEPSAPNGDAAATTGSTEVVTPTKPQKLHLQPDDYYPTKLASQKLPGPLKPLSEIFPHIWPIKTPGEHNRMHSPLYAMLNTPLPKPKEDKKRKGPKPPTEGRNWKNQRTSITEFISTKEELAENGFALHPAHLHNETEVKHEKARRYKACQEAEDGWTDLLDIQSLSEGKAAESDIEGGSILQGRKLLVADCEMVTTSRDKFALARISIIDWDGNKVLDEFVKPPDPVQDYLTQYSGVTKEHLDSATLTLPDIQEKLRSICTPHTILAGHSLDSDLRALKMSYPFIVDTALLYPHPKGPPQKSSLKWLCQKYLNREIQNHGSKGHDSVEDAQSCLDLIKQKCERGKAWGTPDATGEPIFKRLARYGVEGEDFKSQQQANGTEQPRQGKTGAVVDWGDPRRGFGAAATAVVACESDADVVNGIKRCVLGSSSGDNSDLPTSTYSTSPDDSKIPEYGCDLVWGRLRELEAVRGWWNRSKTLDGMDRLARTLGSTKSNGNNENAEPTAQAPADSSADTEPSTGPTAALESNTKTADVSTTAPSTEPSPSTLAAAVSSTIISLTQIWAALPPRTALIVYSGSGDPREMNRLQTMHQEFKRAYSTMKWDELPVKWTDVEEQALRRAAERARRGVGFIGVKGEE